VQTADFGQFEVILIDNNCTDHTPQIASKFQQENPSVRFKYVVETNQGLSYSRNRGINESSAPFLAYIDDDAILDENYVQRSIEFIQANPRCDAFGGPIFVKFLGPVPSWENRYVNSMFGYFNPSNTAFQFDRSNYPRGSNMIFNKDLFSQVGSFNTDLGRVKRGLVGNEEKDLFQRIYNVTDEVYYRPELIVHHIAPEERTTKKFVKRQAIGTGYGEYTRTTHSGTLSYLSRWISECYKWAGTFVLSALHLIKGEPQKAWVLLQFRYWISTGLSGTKPKD
jgi:glycosyltransferase involved in cell wall biosynthesis